MRHLRLYRAIGLIQRQGSIRKAAELLAISPSALNRSILSFEDELGVEIFERLPGGVVLSVAGQLLMRHIDEHLSQMDDYVSLVSEMKGGVAGVLRLSVSSDLSERILPPILARFRQVRPQHAVCVLEDDGFEALQARNVDLALTTRRETIAGVEVVLSHPLQVVGLVSSVHPRAGKRLGVAEIADHAVFLPPEGTGLRAAIDHAFRRHRLVPRAQHVYPRLLASLASEGVPEVQICLSPEVAVGAGMVDLTALRCPPVPLTVLRRSGGALPRPAERFLSVIERDLDTRSGPAANRDKTSL